MPDFPKFKPCWWLSNAHAQTISAIFFKDAPRTGVQDRIELPDGDFIDVQWYGDQTENLGTILLLHGLEGGDHSHYIRSAISGLVDAGYCVVFMFHRGCSGEHNRLDRSYHSGETDDMDRVLAYVEQRIQKRVYAAIGYSLGANALLKYLGEQGAKAKIERAIAISPPFELHAACVKLDVGFSRNYQRHLVGRLIRRFEQKFAHRKKPIDQDVAELKTFLKFDDTVTSKINGFKGAIDYYSQSSCRQYLPYIETPCLIIHAQDDPFLPKEAIPDQSELPHCVTLALSEKGGHVGFVGGRLKPNRWLNKAILAFVFRA